MTIGSEIYQVQSIASGEADFSFTFPIQRASDLRVIVTDTSEVSTVKVLGPDYTVALTAGGGVCSFLTPPPSGYRVTLGLHPAITQEQNYSDLATIRPESIEDALDRVTQIALRQQSEIDRSVKLPEGGLYSNFSSVIPSPVGQVDKAVVVGVNGMTLANIGGAGGGVGDMSVVTYDPAGKQAQVLTVGDVVDEDAMTSNSAAKVPTQQSVKAYVDTQIAGIDAGGGNVSAAAALGDNRLIRGDGGTNGVQQSGITIGDDDAVSGVGTITLNNGSTVANLATPTQPTDAASKAYVDSAIAGVSNFKASVRVATTANGTMATAFDNASVVDGVTLATGDRILVKNQTAGAENGIYIVQASGAPVRATDADSGAELENATVFVVAGTSNADTVWKCVTTSITVGTTALVFNQTGRSGTSSQATRTWIPSDPTGATNMAAELEAFMAASQGYEVRVPDNVTILLNNAFQSVTTGHIEINFGKATILYDNTADAAIFCDNVANASAEVTVSAIAEDTINTNARVTKLTLASTLSASRFDWIAFYTTNANPARAGGFLGEIVQLITDEAGLALWAGRKLNRHAQYTTGMRARKLSAARKVSIRGGIFKANGNTQDEAITVRADGIVIRGFVDPVLLDVMFIKPWSRTVVFWCCAAPRWDGFRMRDVGNLANSLGYTYGPCLYAMNDM
ncbi:MAG: hypothetical protein K2Q12_00890, partial [Rickettsiales bacterium]|nr:hypothetical protein [Rickettsiales bacterium]